MLTLEPECAASSDSFYLPPYYASESYLDLPLFTPDAVLDNSSLPIWRSHWSALLTNVTNSNASLLLPLHIDGLQADAYFNAIEAQPVTPDLT